MREGTPAKAKGGGRRETRGGTGRRPSSASAASAPAARPSGSASASGRPRGGALARPGRAVRGTLGRGTAGEGGAGRVGRAQMPAPSWRASCTETVPDAWRGRESLGRYETCRPEITPARAMARCTAQWLVPSARARARVEGHSRPSQVRTGRVAGCGFRPSSARGSRGLGLHGERGLGVGECRHSASAAARVNRYALACVPRVRLYPSRRSAAPIAEAVMVASSHPRRRAYTSYASTIAVGDGPFTAPRSRRHSASHRATASSSVTGSPSATGGTPATGPSASRLASAPVVSSVTAAEWQPARGRCNGREAWGGADPMWPVA